MGRNLRFWLAAPNAAPEGPSAIVAMNASADGAAAMPAAGTVAASGPQSLFIQ